MVRRDLLVVMALVLFGMVYVGESKPRGGEHHPPPPGFVWQLPEGFPIPRVPADNPMTPAKVELGRHLFHDPRLSADGSIACASCHQPALAYTDGRGRAVGINNTLHPRSAPSLSNVAYNLTLGWDDPHLSQLEAQAKIPLFNTQPLEMGAAGHEAEILARLTRDHHLVTLFVQAFPDDPAPVCMGNVIRALACFERTLISGDSPYDRWAYGGEADALNADERAGARLFFSRRLSCFRCHAGFNFSGPVVYEGSPMVEARFHNTGLYNLDGRDGYPFPNTGVHRHSGRPEDMGKFRAPTLRNIAFTAPYMHDGSVATLEAVIEHYAAGGRALHAPPDAPVNTVGVGRDPLIKAFHLNAEERRQLVAFLHALSDTSFVEQAEVRAPE